MNIFPIAVTEKLVNNLSILYYSKSKSNMLARLSSNTELKRKKKKHKSIRLLKENKQHLFKKELLNI